MSSVWVKTAGMPSFDPLPGDRKTDVLIIGGGIAGILCACLLHQAGVDYTLVEANTLCGGTTKNTTAKITSQHGLIYDKLIRRLGLEKAGAFLRANQAALEKYRELARDIDCDFETRDNYIYSLDRRDKLEAEARALERLDFPAQLVFSLPLPFATAGAVRFPAQAQFHPLKFLAAIARGLHIHEHTKVRELAPGRAVTDRGTIRAERIIVATHFPILNKHGGYFLKLYQSRSYVMALSGAPQLDGMYLDEAEAGLSFRNHGGLLILGGGGGHTGKKSPAWETLSAFAHRAYPNAKEVCRWAAQDCMTLDGVPYVGPYSAGTEGLYVATGFQKWGMTSAMAAAMLLADLMQGKKNPYAPLFDPSRSVFHPQLAVNAAESVLHLLTPTVPRCPHMGCAFKYNTAEHTWDCPCHGSRFAEDGRLLDGPATDDRRR